MRSTTTYPATSKQRAFIEKLLAEKDTTGTAYDGWQPDWSRATSKAASSVIDYLLTLPRKNEAHRSNMDAAAGTDADLLDVDGKPIEAGLYAIHGDHYVRVYMGQQSGRLLVKRISIERDGEQVDVSYEYLGAAARVMVPAATPSRLSADEVAALGKATLHLVDGKWTGTCLHCGRDLDDPESVDRGIGPVCAVKYA